LSKNFDPVGLADKKFFWTDTNILTDHSKWGVLKTPIVCEF
jgi:hypothetical protein